MIVRCRRGHFRQRRPSLTPRWLCKFYFLKSFLVVPTAIATAAFKKRNGCPARRQQHSFQRRLRSCDRGAYCCIAACGGNSTGLVLLPPETKHRQRTRGTCRNNRIPCLLPRQHGLLHLGPRLQCVQQLCKLAMCTTQPALVLQL